MRRALLIVGVLVAGVIGTACEGTKNGRPCFSNYQFACDCEKIRVSDSSWNRSFRIECLETKLRRSESEWKAQDDAYRAQLWEWGTGHCYDTIGGSDCLDKSRAALDRLTAFENAYIGKGKPPYDLHVAKPDAREIVEWCFAKNPPIRKRNLDLVAIEECVRTENYRATQIEREKLTPEYIAREKKNEAQRERFEKYLWDGVAICKERIPSNEALCYEIDLISTAAGELMLYEDGELPYYILNETGVDIAPIVARCKALSLDGKLIFAPAAVLCIRTELESRNAAARRGERLRKESEGAE